MQVDPEQRMSIDEALEHPWVREGGTAADVSLERVVLSGLRAITRVCGHSAHAVSYVLT
jgi:hypothetical protein